MSIFYTDANLTVSTIVYPAGGTFGPRVQRDYQLVMLHSGDLHVRIDRTVHHMPRGHVVLLRPGHTESL